MPAVGQGSRAIKFDIAAIYAWRVELVDSAEAAAALLYLEQVWIFIADVAVQLREKDRTPRSAATPTI